MITTFPEIAATADTFSEEDYLLANPDVTASIRSGGYANARHHFDVCGLVEGRRQAITPSTILKELATAENFHEIGYLLANPDVASAVAAKGYLSGWRHFEAVGHTERRFQVPLNPANRNALFPLKAVYGGTRVIRQNPEISEIQNTVYVPYNAGCDTEKRSSWGIFKEGAIVRDTAFIRGPGENLVGQLWEIDEPATTPAPDDVYIYAGATHMHFGHFLISSMDRFWHSERRAKFLLHANFSPETWFTAPHVAAALSAVGLTATDFAWFDRPTSIRRLIVPGPSFRELHSAHRAYGTLGERIGANLLRDRKTSFNPRPAYLTKRGIKSGVWQLRNESILVDRLESRGVEIISPETLPLADQIDLFQSRPVIVPMGSAHHTTALCTRPCNLTVLALDNQIWSNFKLIDEIKGNESYYYFPMSGVNVDRGNSDFHRVVETKDPERVADELLDNCLSVVRN